MNIDKINMLKDTIKILYSKEGRSLNYISNLLKINRVGLVRKIKEWNFKEAEPRHHLTPSNQKFLNTNREKIKSLFDNNISLSKIALELKVSRDYLYNIIKADEVLSKSKEDYSNRVKENHNNIIKSLKNVSKLDYNIVDFENEIWKPVFGYPDYLVSNYGRVKSYSKRYKAFYLLKSCPNKNTGRLYIRLTNENGESHNLQISRLVGHTFVEGFSEERNTINHKDGNVQNNKSDNLEWVSQSDNNKHSYENLGRNVVNKRKYNFTKILYKGKYEFKTVVSFAKFLNKSETQTRRYLDNPEKYEIELIK